MTNFNRYDRGYLEIPPRLKYWQLNSQYFIELIKNKKKNPDIVIEILNNLMIWNKIKHPDRARKAGEFIAAINSNK